MCNKKNLQLIKEKFDLIVELSNTIEYETRDLTFRENNCMLFTQHMKNLMKCFMNLRNY